MTATRTWLFVIT